MARHSEDECTYCERDVLPLSYIIGEDQELYCSVKCAEAGEKLSASKVTQLSLVKYPPEMEIVEGRVETVGV